MKSLCFMLLALLSASPAWSLTISPASLNLRPSGSYSLRTVQLTNTQQEPIVLSIRMAVSDILPDGRELRRPAEHEFTVVPNRVIIEPGATQVVIVQWRGPRELAQQQLYRIVVEQEPFRDLHQAAPESTNLQLDYRYRYVATVQMQSSRNHEE